MLLTGVILILAIFAVIGWRKGVIRLVLSLVSMIVTILAAVIIAPLATTAIRKLISTKIWHSQYIQYFQKTKK